jgi:apolipoprotein N-acyltransferase
MADPAALARALAGAGAAVGIAAGGASRSATLASVRAAAGQSWLDRPWVKFLLFPLLPALVAFRLHQVIAFGGAFGEAYTYGIGAWLTGLLAWWASWSLGLMLFAGLLRIVIESLTALVLVRGAAQASAARRALEGLGRLVYYAGVPAWLLLRLLSA